MLENPRDLSDRTLREQLDAGRIIIDPLGPNSLQPSSIDLRLDRFRRVFKNHAMGHIDVKQNLEELTELVEVPGVEEPFILHPGEFVLGSTLENVAVPDDLVARLEDDRRSVVSDCSFTRRLVSSMPASMASCAELGNVANLPITLYPNMKIGQIGFQQMTTPADTPYGSSELVEVQAPAGRCRAAVGELRLSRVSAISGIG